MKLVETWNAPPDRAHAHAVLTHDRGGHHSRLLVLVGALSSLPHYRGHRPAGTGLAPRRRRDGARPRVVVPILPAKRAVRRIGLPIEVERCRDQRVNVAQGGGDGQNSGGNAEGSAPGESVAIAANFAVAPASGDR